MKQIESKTAILPQFDFLGHASKEFKMYQNVSTKKIQLMRISKLEQNYGYLLQSNFLYKLDLNTGRKLRKCPIMLNDFVETLSMHNNIVALSHLNQNTQLFLIDRHSLKVLKALNLQVDSNAFLIYD